MQKKILLAVLLAMPMVSKPISGIGVVAGGLIIAKGVAATVVSMKTMGAVMFGYFLCTPTGKKLMSKCSGIVQEKVKAIASNSRLNLSLPISNNSVEVIQSARSFVPYVMRKFQITNIPGRSTFRSVRVAAANTGMQIREYFSGIGRATKTKRSAVVDSDHVQASSESGEASKAESVENTPSFRAAGSKVWQTVNMSYENVKSRLNQANSDEQPIQYTQVNQQMNQQASGLFPRINNHYHYGHGKSNFWKGFTAGTFVTWITACKLFGVQPKQEVPTQSAKPVESPR